MLGARNISCLFNKLLFGAQSNIFHTVIVYTIFVHICQFIIYISKMKLPTIGVFDSGMGGLTVLKALLDLVPNANYLYFGDTARLPYGSKSVETVAKYALEATVFLEQQGA